MLSGLLDCLAITCFYMSLFLYDNEEKQLQNRFESIWKKIEYTDTTPMHTAFLKRVTSITASGFDRVFGRNLISLQAIAVSICLGGAFVSAGIAIFYYYVKDISSRLILLMVHYGTGGTTESFTRALEPLVRVLDVPDNYLHSLVVKISVFSFCLIALAPIPAFLPRAWTRYWLLAVTTIIIAGLYWVSAGEIYCDECGAPRWVIVASALVAGIPFDVFFILLTRMALRWSTKGATFARVLAIIVGNILCAIILITGPIFMALLFHRHNAIKNVFILIAVTNIPDLAISLFVVIVAAVIVFHKTIWFLIKRPIYALQRYRVVSEHKKLTFALGVGLLALAHPRLVEVIKTLIKY